MTTSEIRRQIDARLEDLHRRHRELPPDREVRCYTPGRGYHAPDGEEIRHFGLALASLEGDNHGVGDAEVPFAMQSISKVFTYALALADHGREHVLSRVGVEPSGDSFRSIVFDERARRPYNPMVNAGALVTVDLVEGDDLATKRARILELMQVAAGEPLEVDEDVFQQEIRTDDRNRAIVYLLRSEGMIDGDPEEVLALYLQQCSVTVTCRTLATMAATLANGGVNPVTGDAAFPRRYARDVLTVMYTCGMYDFAGQWAFEVGVPAKSGISGGLLVPIPGKLGIGVYSPGLDEHGNSIRGVDVCREISVRLGLHVFATEEEDALLGLRSPAAHLD
ncbi:MAG: glutaminase A [Thermoanaerobacterales bacterium]|jgi:glutaminase|nr:glutaminase A [Thermoanaerobacterales bacterium]